MADLVENLVTNFAERKVAVIGDLVADQFLTGTIARVSREAPVFIMRHDETVTLPGAAANAAANVAALGGTPILVGFAGTDANGLALSDVLAERGIGTSSIVFDDSIATTTKVRVLGGQPHAARQQVIRIDYEDPAERRPQFAKALLLAVKNACSIADTIVISDYGYGVATADVFATIRLIAAARKTPIIVDSRFNLGAFVGASAATPNQDEVEQILGREFKKADCEALRNKLKLDALLITNGSKGMQLFENGGVTEIAAVGPLTPVDVTGAGDTVIAAFALGLAAGLDYASAARIANHAGGLVVMKKGTATVTAEELAASLAKYPDPTALTNA